MEVLAVGVWEVVELVCEESTPLRSVEFSRAIDGLGDERHHFLWSNFPTIRDRLAIIIFKLCLAVAIDLDRFALGVADGAYEPANHTYLLAVVAV